MYTVKTKTAFEAAHRLYDVDIHYEKFLTGVY